MKIEKFTIDLKSIVFIRTPCTDDRTPCTHQILELLGEVVGVGDPARQRVRVHRAPRRHALRHVLAQHARVVLDQSELSIVIVWTNQMSVLPGPVY